MITAIQKLKADMMHLEKSREDMTVSIEQLEGVLILLGCESTPHQTDGEETPEE